MLPLLLLLACSPSDTPPTAPPTEQLRVPAAGELTGIDANQLRDLLVKPSEKKRLVNFWASWCRPCLAEMPHLKKYALMHPEIDVVLVNVDLPSFRERKVVPLIERMEIGALRNVQFEDPDPSAGLHRVVPEWPDMLPVTLFINTKGEVLKRFHGQVSEEDFAELK